MKTKLLLLLLLANFSIHAQYTSIPDINFEKKLIALGIDSGVADGKVLTSSVSSIINLDVSDSQIADLTGLEDFTSLAGLTCKLNLLSNLDLSKNTKLSILDCRGNKLTGLDFSKLPSLVSVFCSENFITSLDVSKNPILQGIFCSKNELIYLNLKNGNNTKFQVLFFDFTDNPHLNCIEVDDPNYSNLNWANNKDKVAVYSSSCGQSYTNIPDTNFENKLIALGIDTDGKNDRVLTSNIISLKSLDVSNSAITDLTGIENFMGLVTLNVSNNKLTTLNPTYSKDLLFLDSSNNLLTNLDVSKNTSLTALNFSNNKLEEVDLSHNTLLLDLNGASNLLTFLDVSEASVLKNLNCSKNSLTALVVSRNVQLNSLNCSYNQIANLDISTNISLKEISFQDNNLSYLNLKNGANTLLTFLDFKNNPSLDCILVDDVSYSITNWPNYKDSTANYNTNCDFYTLIPDHLFELNLINRGIDSGYPDGKVLTRNLTAVTSLYLSGNYISDLTGIEKFIALKTLDCSSNHLTNLDLSKNKALTKLDCSSNKLTNLDVSNNTSLTTLNCQSNTLTSLDISKNILLTNLNFQLNALTSLDVSLNVALTKIVCSQNKLVTLDLSKNPLLISLDCSFNKISILNLKNGKNNLIDASQSDFKNNANLACILVDDSAYSNTNWYSNKDASANYGATCIRYTYIPDVNFEKELIALGYDSGEPDGHVFTENIEKIDVLNLYSKNISDLSGIQDFTALTQFNCTNNQLANIDLSKNVNLLAAQLAYNQFTNLDLTKNINLIQLDVNVNPLGTIDISKNTRLEHFDCTNTKLTSFDVSKNLYCYENKLTSLDVSRNKKIRNLNCGINSLTAIDVSNNTKMIKFICSNNQITNLDISKNTELSEIQCSNNKLSNLNVSNNLNMSVIICQNNLLTSIDVTKNSFLLFLSCDGNKLTELDVTQNKKLFSLMCFQNQLTILDISKNPVLTRINCSNNKLTSLNLKNGNNINFNMSQPSYLNFQNNSNLTCVRVDDPVFSNNTWSKIKDEATIYSQSCGYPIELASDNFTVETKGESCLGENNGEINITAKEAFAYQANISGKTYFFINNSLNIKNLIPGTYSVSVTIPNEIFEQQFNITIIKGNTITGKSTITSKTINVEITEGTAPFTVFVDGREQFQTTDSNFSLNLNSGGLLEVVTAKACEGVFSKKIVTSDILETLSAYPNPTSGSFEIEIPTHKNEVKIELYNFSGQLISTKTYPIESGKAQLNLENQASGIYAAKVYLETPEYLKIIKK